MVSITVIPIVDDLRPGLMKTSSRLLHQVFELFFSSFALGEQKVNCTGLAVACELLRIAEHRSAGSALSTDFTLGLTTDRCVTDMPGATTESMNRFGSASGKVGRLLNARSLVAVSTRNY